MNITKEKLTELHACKNSITWFEQNPGITTVEQGIKLLWETDHPEKFNWSNWILSRVLTHRNQVKYGVHAAELVLPIWENEFPEDKRPSEAINSVKAWINDPSKENAEKCKQAASDATAWNAANAANATYDATYAARAAAALAAGWAAGWAAAWAAAWATGAASAAYRAIAADPTKKKEIIDYGLNLLQNQE